MRINNNIPALNAVRQFNIINNRAGRTMQQLASGLRIVNARDDAAGLAISESLRGLISGSKAIIRTQEDAYSGLQVAESALNEVSSLLTRAKELAIERNGTADTTAQDAIDAELGEIYTEIDNIETNTEYNNDKLFNGGGTFQIFTSVNGSTETITLSAVDVYGASGIIDSDVAADAYDETKIDTAIDTVALRRAEIGAYQNRYESVINTYESQVTDLSGAESVIRDVDIARAMISYTKDSLLLQSSQAMLVQANQIPGSIIKIFGVEDE
jgi:flagellin